jgi:hypothetical protein
MSLFGTIAHDGTASAHSARVLSPKAMAMVAGLALGVAVGLALVNSSPAGESAGTRRGYGHGAEPHPASRPDARSVESPQQRSIAR